MNPVPVVDSGKLVGIASRSDVVKLLAPRRLHIRPRVQTADASTMLDPLLDQAVVRLERGYIVVDRLRVRFWWLFLIAAFIIGFAISVVWIIRINFS